MRLALVTGPQDPANEIANSNTVIQAMNASTGAYNPAASTVLLGSTTASGAMYAAELPPNFFATAGDRVELFAGGTVAADTNTKTFGITLAQGTTSVSVAMGSSTVSGASWREDFNLIWDGSTFRYLNRLDFLAIPTLAQGSTGTTLVNTAATTITLTAKSDTAASSEVVTLFAGLNIIK